MYFGPVVVSGTCVGLTCTFLSTLHRPHITHHTILHLHISERYSVPDLPHSVPGYCEYTHDIVPVLPWM